MSQNVYQFIDLQRVDPPKKPLKSVRSSLLKSTNRFLKVRRKPGGSLFVLREPLLRVEMSGT